MEPQERTQKRELPANSCKDLQKKRASESTLKSSSMYSEDVFLTIMDLEIIKTSCRIRTVLLLSYYSLTRPKREIATGGLGSVNRRSRPLQALSPRQARLQEKLKINGKSRIDFDNYIGLGI